MFETVATGQLRSMEAAHSLLQAEGHGAVSTLTEAFVAPEAAIHAMIIVPGILGIIYATVEYIRIRNISVTAEDEEVKLLKESNVEEKVKKMNDISGFIAEGAETFLLEEAKYMLVYMIFLIDRQLSGGKPYATIAFVVGATASLLAGWI